MRGSTRSLLRAAFSFLRREGFASPSSLVTDYINLQGTLPAPPAYSGFCQQGKLIALLRPLKTHPLFLTSYFPLLHTWHLNSCVQRMKAQSWYGNITVLYSHLIDVRYTSNNSFGKLQTQKILMSLYSLLCPKKFHTGFWKKLYFPSSACSSESLKTACQSNTQEWTLQGNPGGWTCERRQALEGT